MTSINGNNKVVITEQFVNTVSLYKEMFGGKLTEWLKKWKPG